MNQPGPGRILSPAGTSIQLNCSIAPGNRGIQWLVDVPGRRPSATDLGNTVQVLMQRGITFQGLGSQTSAILFSGQERNSPASPKPIDALPRPPACRHPKDRRLSAP